MLELWNKVRTPRPEYTKKFVKAGGFSGTSISPVYLIQMATEQWGPMGSKWGAREIETRIEDGIWLSKVRLWFPDSTDGVEQWGGTQFRIVKKDGTIAYDDEAAKKSYTDALSKCLSWLGFGADVHMGRFDDVKYVNDAKERFEAEESKVRSKPDAKQDAGEMEIHPSFKNAAERNRLAKELLADISACDDVDFYQHSRLEDIKRCVNGHQETRDTFTRAIAARKKELAAMDLSQPTSED
jgi:hypothetical protein